jgi:hypothetical protein
MTLAGFLQQGQIGFGFPKPPGAAKSPDKHHRQDGEQAAEKK